ncbi:hypothetical protein HanIR_Chr13g0638411 [Helianthus annuus]|nr:hypothetical protein HanIR_Chr13g0638411 [Helianthus annuus]
MIFFKDWDFFIFLGILDVGFGVRIGRDKHVMGFGDLDDLLWKLSFRVFGRRWLGEGCGKLCLGSWKDDDRFRDVAMRVMKIVCEDEMMRLQCSSIKLCSYMPWVIS